MSEHLPECPVPEMDGLWGLPMHPEDAKANCICPELRACEQRVREDERDNCWASVAELIPTEFWANVPGLRDEWWIVKADALAAIDALKEKP